MHILFTNNTLHSLAGSELYVHDMALELQRKGHRISCFTLYPGLISDKLSEKGIRTATTLDEMKALGPVELIHAHHRLEARLAGSCFPHVPIVYASLGPTHPLEQPGPDQGLFSHYIAVSEGVKRVMVDVQQISAEKISVVPNFVDLARFTPKRTPSEKPQRVLLLTNYFTTHGLLEEACNIVGDIEIKAVGQPTESVWNVEDYIDWADVVITSGRGAVQAMAMGRAVVVFRPAGSDGLLTPTNFQASSAHNFNGRAFAIRYDAANLAAQITSYNPAEVEQLQQLVRSEFSSARVADKLLEVYAQTQTAYRLNWPAGRESERYEVVLAELGAYLRGFKVFENPIAHFDFLLADFGKTVPEQLPAREQIIDAFKWLYSEVKNLREYQQNLEGYVHNVEHDYALVMEKVKTMELLENQTRHLKDELALSARRFAELESDNHALNQYAAWLTQSIKSQQADLQALLKTRTVRYSQALGRIWKKPVKVGPVK